MEILLLILVVLLLCAVLWLARTLWKVVIWPMQVIFRAFTHAFR